jgi:hypothetical protein
MPAGAPVRRPRTGILLDESWTAMFQDGSQVPVLASGHAYWTGSSYVGGIGWGTCEGWTIGTDVAVGSFGYGDVAGVPSGMQVSWAGASAFSCDQQRPLLCACW